MTLRPLLSEPLSGMTVNERLFSRGLLGSFDAAASRRDRKAMLSLLREVELSEVDAVGCVNAIFADPKRFGF
jgi:hypothetical protein